MKEKSIILIILTINFEDNVKCSLWDLIQGVHTTKLWDLFYIKNLFIILKKKIGRI
jgi:hypothetical protein